MRGVGQRVLSRAAGLHRAVLVSGITLAAFGAFAGFDLARAQDAASSGSTANESMSADTTAATPAPPEIKWSAPANPTLKDAPNDNGHAVHFTWSAGADDAQFLSYEIFRIPATGTPESEWFSVGNAPKGTHEFTYKDEDETREGKPNPGFVKAGTPITLAVRGVAADGSLSAWSAPATATPKGNWFHTGMVNVLLATVLFGFAVVYFIERSKKGASLYIRPIPGISAVDEAIGRATEMGRPILFVLGTGTAGDIATIAGYTILARVAKKTAEYQTPILVPVNDPVMMAMAQETVKEAYLAAGRPEVYRPESVYYISAMQFPYVAAVNGVMLRERTATNFYMGVFHAESLLLAEAGSMTGSIQISGTDQVSQIPFFVAATDYTLIGEELYAASAYLSQDPVLMGPLKAQDWAKIAILLFILLGVLAWTFGSDIFYQWSKTV